MHTDPKRNSLLKVLAGFLAVAIFAYIAQLFFSFSYDSFVNKYFYFVGSTRKGELFIGRRKGLLTAAFHIAKYGSVLLAMISLYRTYKVAKGSNYLFFRKENKWSEYLPQNTPFLKGLPRPVLFVLLIILAAQVTISVYLAATVPFFYDEAWSFMYFSGRGIFAAMCYYPAPNNHVFFNVLAGIVNVFNFDPVITLRIPSILFGMAATYYFFKIGNRLFSPVVALLATGLFSYSFPQIYFINMGRGYAMLIFFAVLIIYSMVRLYQEPGSKKYMFVYVVASMFGFYTIPSFLYCYLPVAFILGVFYLRRGKLLLRYLLASGIAGVGTWLLYSPIIYFNGMRSLTNNNGVITRDIAYIKEHAKEHFLSTWRFLSGYEQAGLLSLGILLAYLFIRMLLGKHRLVVSLLALYMLSPLLFIVVQKVIPFDRTWSYLIVPIVLTFGFLLNDIACLISKGIKSMNKEVNWAALISLIPIAALAYFAVNNLMEKRPVLHMNDYWARSYIDLIKERIVKVKVVGFADEDLNFYLAEDLQFEAIRRTRKFEANVNVMQPDSIPRQDVLVIKKGGAKVNFQLGAYEKLVVEEPLWDVYIRKDL